jgi:hypothetical protein
VIEVFAAIAGASISVAAMGLFGFLVVMKKPPLL